MAGEHCPKERQIIRQLPEGFLRLLSARSPLALVRRGDRRGRCRARGDVPGLIKVHKALARSFEPSA